VPQNLWKPRPNLVRKRADNSGDLLRERRNIRIVRRCALLEAQHASVSEHHIERNNMLNGPPEQYRVRAGGVVADHAPDCGVTGGGDIRSEHQSKGQERLIELVEYHARLNNRAPLHRVDSLDGSTGCTEVDDHRLIDRLPGERSPTATRQDRDSMLRADANCLDTVRNGGGDHHADGLDLKDARICGIQHSIAAPEAHLTLHALNEIISNTPPSALVNHR
jgi:hypothetical protein